MFEKFDKVEVHLKPNRIKIPVNYINDTDEFNAVYQQVYNQNWQKFEWTDKKYIQKKHLNYPSYNWRKNGNGIDLTILSPEGFFTIRHMFNKYAGMSGLSGKEGTTAKYVSPMDAFNNFKSICAKYGVNLNDYKIDNGLEVKKEIEKTMIRMDAPKLTGENKTYIAHHIDIHSAWPAALARLHPEFQKPIEYIYKKKEEESKKGADSSNNVFKAILNYSIGWMQSIEKSNAQWAHLSRDAINDNNRYMRELAQQLKDSGRMVLAYNTDGIWYCGDIYHGAGEGEELGQWSNDHTNCAIRFKSAGSYEYIENGKYKPVVRGKTKLEQIKPRDKWEWGDIFTQLASEIIKYKFIEVTGLIPDEEGEDYEFKNI